MLYIIVITVSVITVGKTQALSAGHGAWVPLLCTGLIFGVMSVIVINLNKMFEGDTLFEYSTKIVGKAIAYILAIVYVIFFCVDSTYFCITFFGLVKSNFLPKSPQWALLLVSMPFLGFIAYKGMTNAGRLSELIGIVFLVVSLIITITMFFEGRIDSILPLYVKSETGKYFSAIKDTIDQFVGIAIITLIPVRKADKKISKVAFFTMIGVALFYILDVYGCYAIIGMDEIKNYNYPLIDAIRLVQYKQIEFFQRVDIAYQTIGFMRVFAAKGIIYLAIVEYLCKIFSRAKRLAIVIYSGVVLYAIDIFAFGVPEISVKLFGLREIFALVVSFFIPTMLLIIAKVKLNGKKSS